MWFTDVLIDYCEILYDKCLHIEFNYLLVSDICLFYKVALYLYIYPIERTCIFSIYC